MQKELGNLCGLKKPWKNKNYLDVLKCSKTYLFEYLNKRFKKKQMERLRKKAEKQCEIGKINHVRPTKKNTCKSIWIKIKRERRKKKRNPKREKRQKYQVM